jgi:hypothetical protein
MFKFIFTVVLLSIASNSYANDAQNNIETSHHIGFCESFNDLYINTDGNGFKQYKFLIDEMVGNKNPKYYACLFASDKLENFEFKDWRLENSETFIISYMSGMCSLKNNFDTFYENNKPAEGAQLYRDKYFQNEQKETFNKLINKHFQTKIDNFLNLNADLELKYNLSKSCSSFEEEYNKYSNISCPSLLKPYSVDSNEHINNAKSCPSLVKPYEIKVSS